MKSSRLKSRAFSPFIHNWIVLPDDNYVNHNNKLTDQLLVLKHFYIASMTHMCSDKLIYILKRFLHYCRTHMIIRFAKFNLQVKKITLLC